MELDMELEIQYHLIKIGESGCYLDILQNLKNMLLIIIILKKMFKCL